MFRENKDNIKILSPSGFSNFKGIQKVKRNLYQHIIFDDNSEIKTSINHPFGKDKILARNVKVGDYLSNKKVLYNELVDEEIELYDPINVEKENLYITNGVVSHNCEFLGSVDTLISASKLRMLSHQTPIKSHSGLDIYEEVKKDHHYMMTVDVARGDLNDYSAFVIFDISQMPYRIVGKYRNNEIKQLVFPNIIHQVAKNYNQAEILVEVNDIGGQVADTLQFDLEYDNMIMVSQRGRSGQIAGSGFSGKGSQMGLRTTKAVKKIACSNLKQMIEADKLIVNDFDIISELSTFILKGTSKYEADDGCSDDLVACCLFFAWLTTQIYFKELTDNDLRSRIFEEQQNLIEQDMAPFGFVDNGVDTEMTEDTIDEYGVRWTPVVRKGF